MQIWKVGSHGADVSCSAELASLMPLKTAVVSCGEDEENAPSEEVTDRLEGYGANVYRTDKEGGIIVGMADGGHTVRCLGK